MKAEDVVFILNRAMGIRSSVRPHATIFGSITFIDDFRFQIILDKPKPLPVVQLAQINVASKSWIVRYLLLRLILRMKIISIKQIVKGLLSLTR
mgnify:CR=1 FL=1